MGFTAVSDAADAAVRGATAMYHEMMIKQHLSLAIDHAEEGGPGFKAFLGEILSAALETVAAGYPPPRFLTSSREDADWWADLACPAELEAYVGAGLRAIERRTFATAARKRLFVALWETMPDEDRRRFLTRVDPAGKFVRGAA